MAVTRIVVFGPHRRVGVWAQDLVIDLNRADARLPSDLLGLIESGEAGLEEARRAVARALASRARDEGAVLDAGTVALHAPAVDRPRIGCAAGNYAAHTLGSARRKGVGASVALAGLVEEGEMPTSEEVVAKTRERGELRGFWKDFARPRGPGDTIAYPDRCERLDYEGEVAVVLGREARDVAAGRGGEHVWGVTLLNDLTIRQHAPKGRLSFNLSKNWDGSATVGPCILAGDVDPAGLDVCTRVNGELRQQYNSGDMIFSHADYIEYLSRDFSLLPGDMISGGSGPGTATDAEKDLATGEDVTEARRAALYLQIGDVVEVSSPAIGTLRNVVAAKGD